MRIVDINNHYIFTDLVVDFDRCETLEELNEVDLHARETVNPAWDENVKRILRKHKESLYNEAAFRIRANDRLEGILEHKIFDGTIKERFKFCSDEVAITKTFEAVKEELRKETDALKLDKSEKRILERYLFEMFESAKKEFCSSYVVFFDELARMFDSADTTAKLDAAYREALAKIQGHSSENWTLEVYWIETRKRVGEIQLEAKRVLDRDADASDLWRSDLVQKFDISELTYSPSAEAQNLVVNRYDEFVSGCRLKKGKAAELAYKIFNLQFSLIAAQTRVDEYSDISGRISGLQTLNAALKASGSNVRLQSIDMAREGRVSSVLFEAIEEGV